MARKNGLTQIPRTIGKANDGDDGSDLIEDDEDDGQDLAGDDYDDADDDGADPDDEDSGDLDEDDYDTSGELASLRASNAAKDQQIASLLGKGTGGTDGDVTEDVDLEDLPDPVREFGKFKTALSGKIKTVIKGATSKVSQSTAAANAQAQVAAQAAQLERDFERAFPKLAKKKALLHAAVMQEHNAIAARGADANAIMFGQSDKFIKKVAGRMYAELGMKGGDEKTMRRQQQNAGRTRGVSRGTSNPDGSRKQGRDNGKPVPFSKQILQHQAKLGLI